jgi:hypothetical protein
MRPNRLFVRAYLSRGAGFWLATRVAVTGVVLLAGASPLRLSVATAAEVILLSGIMSVLETHRRRERALLANLGVSPFLLGALFLGPALVGEIALRLGGTAFL